MDLPQDEDFPDWFFLIQEARYLRVSPWDLLHQATFWRSAAREAMGAEQYARDQKSGPNPIGT